MDDIRNWLNDPNPINFAFVHRKVYRGRGPVRGVLDQDLHVPLDQAQSDKPEIICETI